MEQEQIRCSYLRFGRFTIQGGEMLVGPSAREGYTRIEVVSDCHSTTHISGAKQIGPGESYMRHKLLLKAGTVIHLREDDPMLREAARESHPSMFVEPEKTDLDRLADTPLTPED